MKVGILGTGSVGTSLATGFADAGYEVVLGSRDPSQSRLAQWAAADPDHRSIGDYRQAASVGGLVVMAVPGRVLKDALDLAGRIAFSGSIVIDVTNPVLMTDKGVTDAYGDEDSGAEFLQRELPDVPVVKAFNQINAEDMMHPEHSRTQVLRICGDDEHAKHVVADVLDGFGWEIRDLGPLSRARALEHGVIDWIRRLE